MAGRAWALSVARIVARINAGDTERQGQFTMPLIFSITPTSAAAGSTFTMTITGSGFQGIQGIESSRRVRLLFGGRQRHEAMRRESSYGAFFPDVIPSCVISLLASVFSRPVNP
jgi:hypothetical protein